MSKLDDSTASGRAMGEIGLGPQTLTGSFCMQDLAESNE